MPDTKSAPAYPGRWKADGSTDFPTSQRTFEAPPWAVRTGLATASSRRLRGEALEGRTTPASPIFRHQISRLRVTSLAHLVLQKCKISAFTLWGCLGGCRGELN